jgi:Divergent InlB B-repeat domain
VDLAPGEVNGDWAVWHKCSSRKECDVIRYHIPDGDKTRMPNRGGRHYSPAVSSAGTVFFARSRGGCGSGVRLVSRSVDGTSAVLTSLPSGDDVSAMDAYTDPQGTTTLLFDQFDCARAAVSDAWQIEEDLTPTLTVNVEGDGDGTVTSSPPGINCGTDCSETYEFGTGVTLTAEPALGVTFAGWSGACTGSTSTCTLQMNGPRFVTATFANKPVLTVKPEGTGSGTVMSSPLGINCGADCNEPYDEGTIVTLTATPAPDSTFSGWSACSGTGACTVTMNDSKEVIATFTLQPPPPGPTGPTGP